MIFIILRSEYVSKKVCKVVDRKGDLKPANLELTSAAN